MPIRPQRRAFPWTIGRVIDRGHPKLCFPNAPQPLDPAMRVQCRVDVPVYAHGGPRNRTCVLRSRVICEHTNGSRASSPRAIGSFVQDMMLCPQGVGALAGESAPRTCAQSAPAISSTARARPRGCRWRTTPSMRSPELDGASSRRSYAQSPPCLPHTHGPPCHLTR